jgi:hypothetical protein
MDDARNKLWVIWGSMFGSLGTFAAVVAMVEVPADPRSGAAMTGLGLVALSLAGVSLAWGRLFLQEQQALQRWIVRWALADGVGALGVAAHFMGGPMSAAMGLIGLAFVLVAVQFPREDG